MIYRVLSLKHLKFVIFLYQQPPTLNFLKYSSQNPYNERYLEHFYAIGDYRLKLWSFRYSVRTYTT